MFKKIYIENQIKDHPSAIKILNKYPGKPVVYCDHYKNIFNPSAQDFRAQKKSPSLILAKQTGIRVLPTPEGFGVGGARNYYFSHFLNCLYDCQYCFLQGLYPSANFVWFVNHEDFMRDISGIASELNEPSYFFSGYDCDSLAMDPLTRFIDTYMPFFKAHPNAILELRTKSTQISSLIKHEVIDNCVVAFSISPSDISNAVEIGVPSLQKRLDAMARLAELGWRIGVRLDPLIYSNQFNEQYKTLCRALFTPDIVSKLHSVSVGPMRFPQKIYKKVLSQHPDAPLLAHPLEQQKGVVSYPKELEQSMTQFVMSLLEKYIPNELIFKCHAI